MTGGFPPPKPSNVKSVFIPWRRQVTVIITLKTQRLQEHIT